MAVVSLKNAWRNADSMNVYFPVDAGTVTRGGERDFDGRHETFFEVDLTALPTVASGNIQIVAENVVIPIGSFIENVEVLTTKAATGATATFDVGLVDLADRTTEIDFNGLVAAGTVASIAALGTFIRYNKGSTSAGALVGTRSSTTKAGLLTMNASTADFTAGKLEVRVHWFVPLAADL